MIIYQTITAKNRFTLLRKTVRFGLHFTLHFYFLLYICFIETIFINLPCWSGNRHHRNTEIKPKVGRRLPH